MSNTAKLFMNGRSQAGRLPKESRFQGAEVNIRREGDAVILEPVRRRTWPKGFFDRIHIKDKRFKGLPQGETPPAPDLT